MKLIYLDQQYSEALLAHGIKLDGSICLNDIKDVLKSKLSPYDFSVIMEKSNKLMCMPGLEKFFDGPVYCADVLKTLGEEFPGSNPSTSYFMEMLADCEVIANRNGDIIAYSTGSNSGHPKQHFFNKAFLAVSKQMLLADALNHPSWKAALSIR